MYLLQYVLWDREYRGHKANDMSSCLKVPDFLVFYVKQFITVGTRITEFPSTLLPHLPEEVVAQY